MKVKNVNIKELKEDTQVIYTDISDGYVSRNAGQLPDVDIDFESTRRQEVKEYIENRYNVGGKQRVFSAGTLTTLKIKAAIKDVARTYRVPVSLVNYITAIFDDDKMTWTDLFKLAYTNKKVKNFIVNYPQVIEDIRGLMGQPRSSSVHASALIVTPNLKDGKDYECFDFTPIKKENGILVSEFDGYTIDEVGLLKNDCLGIKELSKIKDVLKEVNKAYGTSITFEDIVHSGLDDEDVYEMISNGHTQNIFQFSSKGMTKFLMQLKPSCINDLIAANALYRPATLESKSTERYIDCKHGLVAPTYLWGAYNALKESYGLLCYQEQISSMAKDIGGFSLGDGVRLMKIVSKKKADKMAKYKDRFLSGAKKNGCPDEDAKGIWDMIESGASYLFNKCISGKEKIKRISDCGRWHPTIAEMYLVMHDYQWAKSHGHDALHYKYKNNGYGTAWSFDNKAFLVKNRIKDIRYMGLKPLYRITLENGMTIDVTNNHKHPTSNGIKRTDEIRVGVDKMIVSNGYIKTDTVYRFTNKGYRNDKKYHSNDNLEEYEVNSKKGHCGFVKKETRYTQLKEYNNNHKKDYCEKCLATDTRLEVHHINKDHSDCGENFSNLQTLCVSCHKKAHYDLGRTKQGERGLDVETYLVVSIDHIGFDEVYDVEMCDPYHTFAIDNGIITCNSHATAYAVTSYVGAYLKCKYPAAFYNTALQWADDKELPSIMMEIEQFSSDVKIVSPDINVAGTKFFTDYKTNEIFWSLTRIKMVGEKTVDYIVRERDRRGQFQSLEDFIMRIFRHKVKHLSGWDYEEAEEDFEKCPVNARHLRNMIIAGCFDNVENVHAVAERYVLINKAADMLGFALNESDFPPSLVSKHYFWSMQQVAVSGIGAVDYKRIFDNHPFKSEFKGSKYTTVQDILDLENETHKCSLCAFIADGSEISYKDKTTGENKIFCKLELQVNNDIVEMVLWDDFYKSCGYNISELKGRIVLTSGVIRYSEYTGKNCIHSGKNSKIFLV